MCVCMCSCQHGGACHSMNEGVRGELWGFILHVVWTGSAMYIRLARGFPGILLSPVRDGPGITNVTASSFHTGTGDLNSGPHACRVSTLSTESSLLPKCSLKLGTPTQKGQNSQGNISLSLLVSPHPAFHRAALLWLLTLSYWVGG